MAKEGTPTIGLNVTLHIKPERRDEFIAVVDKNAIGTNTTEAGAHLYVATPMCLCVRACVLGCAWLWLCVSLCV